MPEGLADVSPFSKIATMHSLGLLLLIAGIVVLMFAGLRIRALMDGLTSGARMFARGLHDEDDMDRELRELKAELMRKSGDDKSPSMQAARMPRFTGRNLNGVPVYAGPLTLPDAAEERRAWRRAEASAAVAFFAVLLLAFPPANPTTEVQVARMVFLVVCIATVCLALGFASHGWQAREARRRFGGLTSVEEFSERRGVPELTFLLTARAQGVEPRCIVNGKEYYDLADFGDAAVLLRPAEAPDGDALLRPAGHADTDDEERLLRPAAGDRRE